MYGADNLSYYKLDIVYPRNLAESTTICNFAVENRETRRRLSRSTSGRLLPKGRKNLSELDCIRLARALQSKT